jgi:hypothetical protein
VERQESEILRDAHSLNHHSPSHTPSLSHTTSESERGRERERERDFVGLVTRDRFRKPPDTKSGGTHTTLRDRREPHERYTHERSTPAPSGLHTRGWEPSEYNGDVPNLVDFPHTRTRTHLDRPCVLSSALRTLSHVRFRTQRNRVCALMHYSPG